MKKPIVALVMAMLVGSALAEEIRITSGGTSAAYLLNPIKEAFEKSTGIRLLIKTGGGRYALSDLDSGAADLGAAGHTIQEMVESLTKEGVTLKNPGAVKTHEMGSPIEYGIAVNGSNPVTNLTAAQLGGIYTGKIKNWKEVGGADKDVIVVWPKLQIAANNILVGKFVPKGESPTKDILDVNTYEDVAKTLAATPEGIGLLMPIMADGKSVKRISTPTLSTGPLNFFTVGDPSPKLKKLMDFVKGEGAKLLPK